MIGIPVAALGLAASPTPTDVVALAEEAGLPAKELERLHDNGLRKVPVSPVGTPALVAEAVDAAVATGWNPATCTTAVVTHSLALGETDFATVVALVDHRCPGLPRRPLVVSGRPCSILHLGIELARTALVGAPGGSTALVVGADVAPTTDDRFFFGSAMGDAGVALVLGGEPRLGTVLSTASDTHVLASEGARSTDEDIARFRAENATAVRAVIEEALADAGVTWDELAAIVPHTPYHAIWDAVATLCRFPRDLVLDDGVARTGHLNSNDVLVHYASGVEDGRIRPGDVVALVSPGFGGTRSCTVVRR